MEKKIVDRISALPDSIIHHIFSFLDIREVVHTSILSNRWRYVWTSTPCLNFHLQMYPTSEFDFHHTPVETIFFKRDRFVDFVDRVLMLHDDHFGIYKFSLFCDEELNADHLCAWLSAALSHHVQVLCLHLYTDRPLELPRCLFTSNITVLEFSNNNFFRVPIQMPESLCSAARLKSLQLKGVKLPDGSPDGGLILSCPVLESLIMFECDHSHLKVLTISALLLERLDVYTPCWERTGCCAIDICSPRIKSLKLNGSMYKGYSLLNLSALDSAHVNIYGDCRMQKEVYEECVIKVLKGVNNVKALTVSPSGLQFSCAKILTENPELLERLPDFHNLRYLVFGGMGDSLYAVLKFLLILPCVESLVCGKDEMKLSSANIGGDWGANLPLHNTFECLKTVEIWEPEGNEGELRFLEILLKRSPVLKEMVMNTNGEHLLDNSHRLSEFQKKLLKLPKASSSVAFHFCEGVKPHKW